MTNPVGAQVWSQTAANNATVDGSVNWAEGMAPSQVNDSARAEMASMAKFISDNNGTLVTGGSSVAFTVATNQVESALTAGYTVALTFHVTPDSSATLAVDGLSGVPMQVVRGTNLKGGEYKIGSIARFTYSSTGTGQWVANCAEVAVPGATDGSNANAGLVGEYQSSLLTTATSISVTNSTAAFNVTSLSLTAGDWDLSGEVFLVGSGVGTARVAISNVTADTSAAAAACASDGFDFFSIIINNGPYVTGDPCCLGQVHTRASSASSATYYLNATASSSGTNHVFGGLRARRIR